MFVSSKILFSFKKINSFNFRKQKDLKRISHLDSNNSSNKDLEVICKYWSLGNCFRSLARSLWTQMSYGYELLDSERQLLPRNVSLAVSAGGEMGTLLCLSRGRRQYPWLHSADLGRGQRHRPRPRLGPKGWGEWRCIMEKGHWISQVWFPALMPYGWKVKVWSPASPRHILKHMFI